MVQKLRHHHEHCRLLGLVAEVDDGRRQVRLAAAGGPLENQPAPGVFGEIQRQAVGPFEVVLLLLRQVDAAVIEAGEGHALLQLEPGSPGAFGLSRILFQREDLT